MASGSGALNSDRLQLKNRLGLGGEGMLEVYKCPVDTPD